MWTDSAISRAADQARSPAVYGYVLLVLVIIFLGYAVSLRLHPYRPCRSCDGKGRKEGSFFRRAYSDCTRCNGKGRTLRAGVRIFSKRDR